MNEINDKLNVPPTTSVITTERFLEIIHGPDAIIYWNVAKKTWKNKPQRYLQAEKILKWRNEQGDDIFYIINSGGSTDASITRINSTFGDLDAGRNNEGKYFSDVIVAEKKNAFLKRIHDFSLKPTLLVETRNGFHPYWVITNCSIDQFREIQKRIAVYFDGDRAVCNPARVMRLPGYYWYKKESGLPPFYVRVIEYNDIRYSVSDLLQAFPPCPEEHTTSCKIKQSYQGPKDRISTQNNSVVYPYNTAFIMGTNPVSKDKTTLSSMSEAIEFIKIQSLPEFLGICSYDQISPDKLTVCCPVHADSTPSATLYRNPEDQHWLFKCHSTNCGKQGTIIDIVMLKDNSDEKTAITKLMKYFGIEVVDTWKADQRKILEANIMIVQHLEQYKEQYPNLYRVLNRIRQDLLSKLRIAEQCLDTQAFSKDGKFIFFCSLNQFERVAKGKSDVFTQNHQNQKVDRYGLLGLITKVNDEEIPSAFRERSICEKARHKHKFHIQYYSIPEYTFELLAEADRIAKFLKDSGVRMKGISRELVLGLMGTEKAQKLYPQCQDEPSESSRNFMVKVESILLADIQAHGFSRISNILQEMVKEHDWRNVTDRRIRKCLPVLMKKHNLIERFSDHALKDKYKLTDNGYPKIIIFQSKDESETGSVIQIYRDILRSAS